MTRWFATLFFFLFSLPLFAAIEIEELETPGGITVWYLPEPSIPMISLAIGFKGGAIFDPAEKAGATYVMTGLLEEGAGELGAVAYAEKIEELSAQFTFDTSRDALSISAQFLKENADEAVDLLRLAVREPRFDEVAFERVKGQVASIVARRATNPDDIASDAFNRVAFAGHPYERPYQGLPETVSGLTRQDIVDAHQRAMSKDRLYIGAVGDFSPDELAKIVDRLFADLPETGPEFPKPVDYAAKPGVEIIEHDSPQSVAIWGQDGISNDDPEFFPAFVMNKILGSGGFGSRLTEEVRVKRGLTYGIYSYLATMDHGHFYGGQVASQNERVAEAIEVIRAEWRRMAEGGVTEEELDAAIKNMTGSYVLRFDGNAQIASILRYSQMDGFPIDYPQNRNSYIEAVTQEDIARVAKKLLKEDELFFVVVGQPEGLDAN